MKEDGYWGDGGLYKLIRMGLTRAQLLTFPTVFSPKVFQVWRVFTFLLAVEVVVLEFATCPRQLHERLRFLTVWGYLLNCCAHTMLFGLTAADPLPRKRPHSLWGAALLLYELAFSIQFPITIVYWVAIYPTDTTLQSVRIHLQNLQIHLLLLLVFIADFFLSGVHFDRSHAKWVASFTLTYLAFNLTCTYLDKPVYPVITWQDRLSFVFAGLAVFLCLTAFFLFARISNSRASRLSSRLHALHKDHILLAH